MCTYPRGGRRSRLPPPADPDQRDGGAAHAEHLRKRALRERNFGAAAAVLNLSQRQMRASV